MVPNTQEKRVSIESISRTSNLRIPGWYRDSVQVRGGWQISSVSVVLSIFFLTHRTWILHSCLGWGRYPSEVHLVQISIFFIFFNEIERSGDREECIPIEAEDAAIALSVQAR